ncbi:MAG: hypothetical protein IIV74_02265 [Alphaproteobacteria bacterium]|nr:hypothetical protein [Alphaproteobacteria bacterium]
MTRNKLSNHKTLAEKEHAYRCACMDSAHKAFAYYSDGRKVPLKNIDISRVEFIAGLWRVQNPFPRNIQEVRGKLFMLSERLDYKEKNLFEFYRAHPVCENCYGAFVASDAHIVAKYTTDKKTYWAYGKTIEQARAFLGIKLYDEYMDQIHNIACKNTIAQQKK